MPDNLDIPILSVLPKGNSTQPWMNTAQIAHALAAARLGEIGFDEIENRLTDLIARGVIDCRISPEGYEWCVRSTEPQKPGEGEISLTCAEALALQCIAQFSDRQIAIHLRSAMHEIFHTAMNRLRSGPSSCGRVIPANRKLAVIERRFTPIPPSIRQLTFRATTEAVLNERWIEFVYRPRIGPSDRMLAMPLGLVEDESLVYLVAKETEECEPKTFRLDRILSVTEQSDSFIYPANFSISNFVAQNPRFRQREHEKVQLVVRFVAGYMGNARDALIACDQAEEILPDGSVMLRCTVALTDALRQWLMSHGPQVEIISPRELRKEFVLATKAMSMSYFRR
jgi:predicted DNA-binding transcriptional regulator YafY